MDLATTLVILYLVLMTALTRPAILRAGTEQDFFSAGQASRWPALACSMAGTLLALTLVAGAIAESSQHGIAFGVLLWLGFVPGAMLAAVLLVPVLARAEVRTLPEYLGSRYTQGVRVLAALAQVLLALLLMAAGLFLIDLLTHRLLGWPQYLGATAVAAVTLWYVHFGGLGTVQACNRYLLVVLLAGAAWVLMAAMQEAGGLTALDAAWQANPDHYRSAFLPADHPDWPWVGVLIGIALVMGPWQWLGNQAVIQHIHSASSQWQAQAGLVFAALALLLAVPVLAGLGLVLQLSGQSGEPLTSAGGLLTLAESLPLWARGVLLLALLAALQSSLGSLLVSSARVIINDLAPGRDGATDPNALAWGRRWTLLLTLTVIAAQPFIQDPTAWTHGFLLLTASFQGPLLALVLTGLLSRAATPAAGMLTLLAGIVVTAMLGLIGMPGLYVAGVSFIFALIMIIAVSKHTPRLPPETLDRLVYRHDR